MEILHSRQVQQPVTTINRAFALIRSVPILAILYYRASHLISSFINGEEPILLSWALISVAEFLLSFLWLVHQAFMWRPVTRSVYPERLPGDDVLPAVDVFICTADPKKEPVIEVMNTVLSSMALDYPPEKLFVYLSDDAGSQFTLGSVKETWCFAKYWIPFCKKFGIKTRCPEAYFSKFEEDNEDRVHRSDEFYAEEETIKAKYEMLKERVEKAGENIGNSPSQDRPSCIEVINANDPDIKSDAETKFPLLVYVSREKRRSQPHHFKAGALNALLRVSGVISNSPYILVLDCDMYCNDPTSAKQAMCFHLDPKISRSLAFVQFPQIFYSISKNDIYDGQMRSAFKTKWQGMDGLKGPVLSGTGFYLKRQALYRSPMQEAEPDLHQLKEVFGTSNEFLATVRANSRSNAMKSNNVLEESRILASSDFEKDTQWGDKIGFLYHCLLESTFTGYYLHCQGWSSVYLYPTRPSFLGCPATNMNDALAQGMKWSSELIRIAVSRFCPLTYGLPRMSTLQSMCYTYFMFSPLYAIGITLYATVTQFCLFRGIPLYPKVSDPWFLVFAAAFLGCIGQHLYEVLTSGGSIKTWWNELRIWIIKSVTANLFGYLDAVMKAIGMKKTDLKLTNKVVDKEQQEKYEKGKFDLQGSKVFLIPLVILVVLNIVSLVVGVGRMVMSERPIYDEMFGQVFLSSFILVLSYPIIEGMITRKSSGSI